MDIKITAKRRFLGRLLLAQDCWFRARRSIAISNDSDKNTQEMRKRKSANPAIVLCTIVTSLDGSQRSLRVAQSSGRKKRDNFCTCLGSADSSICFTTIADT